MRSGVPVTKQWHQLPGGQTFLVESVAWTEIEPQLQNLPLAQRADNESSAQRQVAATRVWPKRTSLPAKREPIQLASLPYQPTGYVMDVPIVLNGSDSSKTFLTPNTYYITNSYSVGPGNAIFQAGCFIKYKNCPYASVGRGDVRIDPQPLGQFEKRRDRGSHCDRNPSFGSRLRPRARLTATEITSGYCIIRTDSFIPHGREIRPANRKWKFLRPRSHTRLSNFIHVRKVNS